MQRDPQTRLRRRRASGDLVMARQPTYGSGLNELDNMLSELDRMSPAGAHSMEQAPRPGRGVVGAATTTMLVAALAVFVRLMFVRPTTCHDVCPYANDGQCDDGGVGSASAGCQLGSDCGDCGARDTFFIPHWAAIVCSLLVTALLVLGVRTVVEMLGLWAAQMTSSTGSWTRIPLTDGHYGVSFINKVANSTQVREKGLKCVQYVLRAIAYSAYFSETVSKQAKSLSKMTSVARRFFKFGRWVKHFEDLEEAKDQKSTVMRALLYLRIAANFGADWAEDVCSLERVSILPAGTLSIEFLLFAEYCQLMLALVEILVTGVRARKEREIIQKAEDTGADPKKLLKQKRKLAVVRLELVKFCSDVGKALYDCELPFAHEGVFIGCSLFSGVLSTHKNIFKIYKD